MKNAFVPSEFKFQSPEREEQTVFASGVYPYKPSECWKNISVIKNRPEFLKRGMWIDSIVPNQNMVYVLGCRLENEPVIEV